MSRRGHGFKSRLRLLVNIFKALFLELPNLHTEAKGHGFEFRRNSFLVNSQLLKLQLPPRRS